MTKLNISSIKYHPITEDQYHRVVHPKKQIVLHHTGSGPNAKGDIDFFQAQAGKVATPFVLDRTGEIWQCFNSRYYAPHLGIPAAFLKKKGFKDYGTRCDKLHKESISIEIDSWGFLTLGSDGKYRTWTGKIIPKESVQYYPEGFRDHKYYEKYTPQQIEATRQLLVYLSDSFGIDKSYKADMWDVSMDALSGKSGIYAHVSYRDWNKTDCHPQPELVSMLKNL